MEGSTVGKARLTGVITNGTREFAVDLVVEGRLNDGEPGYSDTCRALFLRASCGGSSAGWHVYTALSGTLTGKAGGVEGAVYNVSLRPLPKATCTENAATLPEFPVPVAQVGIGANTHNLDLGAFAPLSLVLADDGGNTGLPASVDGEMGIDLINNNSFPNPSPDLTGTWNGSIDCAGIADFTDAETFSGPVTLKVGDRRGMGYDVALSVEPSGEPEKVIATYCAFYTHDLQANSNQGTGLMFSGDPPQPLSTVLLKARKNPDSDAVTLKAREFITLPDGPDGDLSFEDLFPDGVNFCKWTFTQTNTADLGISRVCR